MSRSVKPLNRYIVGSAVKSADSAIQQFHNSTILITNRQRTKKINAHWLQQIMGGLMTELNISGADLGINLVGAKEMAKVNWNFLRHEGSTDVITFDHTDDGGERSSLPADGAHGVTRPTLHGELFICVDEAVFQAKQFGTNWQSEILRYVVHGVLHLSGHDDLQPDLRRKMKRAENRLVRVLAKRFSLAQLSGAAKLGT
jgi:probable rRNA maturation factor